jgi:hypothetical protein
MVYPSWEVTVGLTTLKFMPLTVIEPPTLVGEFIGRVNVTTGESYVNDSLRVPTIVDSVSVTVEMNPSPSETRHCTEVVELHAVVWHWVDAK